MLELTENVEPTFFLTSVEHANHYTIKVVLYATYNSLWQVTNIQCIMTAFSFGIISVNEAIFLYIFFVGSNWFVIMPSKSVPTLWV